MLVFKKNILATYRDRFLTKIVTIHLELFVLLHRSVEKDNDIHLGGLKGAREKLNKLKTAIELSATSPICWQSIMIINVVVVVFVMVMRHMENLLKLTRVVAAIEPIKTSFYV
jgi:hypothetical protein